MGRRRMHCAADSEEQAWLGWEQLCMQVLPHTGELEPSVVAEPAVVPGGRSWSRMA